jgi:hypothetical protein
MEGSIERTQKFWFETGRIATMLPVLMLQKKVQVSVKVP